jgi:hemoglobin/transferrin/lactoferrin receptor protein
MQKKRSDYSESMKIIYNMHQSPGFYLGKTYNFKTSFQVYEGANCLQVENILDTQYRTFSSGINAPK